MSGEENPHKMRLRSRRSALTDISNRASVAPPDTGKPVPSRPKRMRASLEGDEAELPSSKLQTAAISSSTSSSSSSTANLVQLVPVGTSAAPTAASEKSAVATEEQPQAKKKRPSELEIKQEYLPPHRVTRSIPLSKKNANPAHCLDLIDRMYQQFYELEDRYCAKPYLARQSDINAKMRAILVDWLVEVHYKFKLLPETLWLCVNIMDRYLEQVPTQRSKLQLVGVSSLLIACKYEEIYPPEVRDCVYITDYAYDRKEVLKMESAILKQLDYQICVPTGFHFLARYLNCIQASERTRFLASYYSERNLQEADMLQYQPHKFVAAALYAALKQQNCHLPKLKNAVLWSVTLEEESGLKESDLLPCARTIMKHVNEEPETASKRKLNAAKKKYNTEKFGNVSALPLPTI